MKIINKGNKCYKIIPESGVVVGEAKTKEFFNELDGLTRKQKMVILMAGAAVSKVGDFTKAKATCDDHDEFNEKVGIEVCGSKIDCKQHMRLAKQYDRMYRLLAECCDFIYKKCQYHMNKAETINNDLVCYYGRKR